MISRIFNWPYTGVTLGLAFVVAAVAAVMISLGPIPKPRFAVGDMVEVKGLGQRGIVLEFTCHVGGCNYTVMHGFAAPTKWVPEAILEKVER